MKGKYRYNQEGHNGIIGHILISVTETAKAYTFKLLENTTRYDYDHFMLLFKNGNTTRINKEKSPHAIIIWEDGDFTIYPYRAGIPFLFKKEE